jgi:hypothetical protein
VRVSRCGHWDWCPTLDGAAEAPTRDEQADALASVLAYSGHAEAAARWVLGHASGDDDGDQHAGIDTYERVLVYVRHMWGMEAAA